MTNPRTIKTDCTGWVISCPMVDNMPEPQLVRKTFTAADIALLADFGRAWDDAHMPIQDTASLNKTVFVSVPSAFNNVFPLVLL